MVPSSKFSQDLQQYPRRCASLNDQRGWEADARSCCQAAELNTVEEISSRNTLHARISAANQFLLHQICQDSKRMSSPNASLDQVGCSAVLAVSTH